MWFKIYYASFSLHCKYVIIFFLLLLSVTTRKRYLMCILTVTTIVAHKTKKKRKKNQQNIYTMNRRTSIECCKRNDAIFRSILVYFCSLLTGTHFNGLPYIDLNVFW